MLVMGIDQESDTIEEKDDVSGESGQADTIFLIVMDKSKDEIKMISISRDTMTQIKTFDYKGNYLGKSKNHLGLAYSFGDGKVTSCQYMVDAEYSDRVDASGNSGVRSLSCTAYDRTGTYG